LCYKLINWPRMEITPLGDSAVILRVCDDLVTPSPESLQLVLETLAALKAAAMPGVIELAPTYTTIGAFFDPVVVAGIAGPEVNPIDWFRARITDVVGKTKIPHSKQSPLIEIPVCYDAEFGCDLEDVASHTGLSVSEIIRIHSSAEYRVHFVGFTPGFPYLGGLPNELATPRRSQPRKRVTQGSVAIGGSQTGIYPTASPGGWNIIGRTPLRLFSPLKDPPAQLRGGDTVRFRAITREEFDIEK
jgi:inhibitor of KinA